MAIYRTVSMSFWTDPKVTDDFTPEDRYFYLYLFTNPHTNLCGCYEISLKQMSVETGYSKETIENLIERFDVVHEVISYSPETKEILLLNWHKYNWTSSEKFRKPLLKELQHIKNEMFAEYLFRMFNGENDGYPIDTTCIDITDTVSVTDTDTVSNTVSDKKSKRFVPPTVEEVQEYINEKGYHVDAESFVNFYASKGWMVGKTKMVSWRSSVATWEKRHKEENDRTPPKQTGSRRELFARLYEEYKDD